MSDGKVVTLYPREAVHLPFLLAADQPSGRGPPRGHIFAEDRGRELCRSCRCGQMHTVVIGKNHCQKPAELFIRGDGPRVFFTYRTWDLPEAPSDEFKPMTVTELRLISTVAPAGTTLDEPVLLHSWRIRDIDVENHGSFHLVPGDAMTLGREMRHNVLNIKRGYNVIEVCLPADYTTVAQNARFDPNGKKSRHAPPQASCQLSPALILLMREGLS